MFRGVFTVCGFGWCLEVLALGLMGSGPLLVALPNSHKLGVVEA